MSTRFVDQCFYYGNCVAYFAEYYWSSQLLVAQVHPSTYNTDKYVSMCIAPVDIIMDR